jgi:hypothetical protein
MAARAAHWFGFDTRPQWDARRSRLLKSYRSPASYRTMLSGKMELLIDAPLSDIPRLQILTQDLSTDARIDEHRRFLSRFVDAGCAEPP